MQIEELVSAQRAFFNTGATKDAAFRRRALAALRQAVTAREADICAALKGRTCTNLPLRAICARQALY